VGYIVDNLGVYRSRGGSVVEFVECDKFLRMPAKRDKRAAAKVPKELEESETNAEEQELEKQPIKKKGRVPKVKPVPEQPEVSEKKPGRGRKNKGDLETEENEGVSKEVVAAVSKRGQAWKKTETEKPMDTGTEAEDSQRKGAIRATKKAADLGEERGEKEQKPVKGRGRKVADKGMESEDAEPSVKKSRVRPKNKEESSETTRVRKVRQQKAVSKGKVVTESGDGLTENGGSGPNPDKDVGKELRVNVEHW